MTAPPTIPVTKIPEKEPCASATEFSAKEIIIDHMVAIKNPMAGKAINACELFPCAAAADAALVPQTAGDYDAEIAAAAQDGSVERRRVSGRSSFHADPVGYQSAR